MPALVEAIKAQDERWRSLSERLAQEIGERDVNLFRHAAVLREAHLGTGTSCYTPRLPTLHPLSSLRAACLGTPGTRGAKRQAPLGLDARPPMSPQPALRGNGAMKRRHPAD